MCWETSKTSLLGCVRQRAILRREYGCVVMETAERYASQLPIPLSRHHMLACISIAQKWVEDEPISRYCLFPGLSNEDLVRAEWYVLTWLHFELRV